MALRLALLPLLLAPVLALAADNSAPPAGDDLKVMREMLEQQSKQLDVLAQEVARLNLLLEAKNGTPSPAAASEAARPNPALRSPDADGGGRAGGKVTASATPAGGPVRDCCMTLWRSSPALQGHRTRINEGEQNLRPVSSQIGCTDPARRRQGPGGTSSPTPAPQQQQQQ